MDSEKETVDEGSIHEEEKVAPEVETKDDVKEDAGEVGAENLGEKEENGDKEEINEEAVKMEEEKEKEKEEGKGDVAEEESVKEEEQGKEGEEEGSGEEEENKGKGKEELKAEEGSKSKRGKAELSSSRTPGIERPTRERKTVDRFVANATVRGSATKLVAIEKGQGTKLKDIPNVAFKLSKRKADENLQLLHTILFGKKAKVQTLKKNIGLFSGFVWIGNEEKQRAKVKDRLDKCVKEKLLDFCDVLNIPVSKATVKKEELSVKLLEFLESPHATTDILLADKDKSKKRKSKNSASKSSADMAAGKSRKKPKLDSESGKKRKLSSDEQNDDKSEHSHSDEDKDDTVSVAESDKGATDSEEEDEEQDEPKKQKVPEKSSSKRSTKKDSGSRVDHKFKAVGKKNSAKAPDTPGNSTKTSSSSKSKKRVSEAETKSEVRTPVTKKRNADKQRGEKNTPPKDTSSSKKKANKSSTRAVEKDQGKKESSRNAKKEPTKEEMHAVVTNILKEVDFNTATLSDILKQLGKHFEIDLMHRKSEIKEIITEVINNMSDDEDEEAAESGDDLGKESKDD